MPTVQFKGTVHPEIVGLDILNIPTINFHEPPCPPRLPNGLSIEYKMTIEKSRLTMVCEVNPWNESDFSLIHNRASMMARTIVDLFSFGSGVSLVVTLDTFMRPDGMEQSILLSDPRLKALVTIMQTNARGGMDFGKSLEIIIQDASLALAMRDLISGVTYPNTAVIDCARAVEGIRHLIDPNLSKRGNGWGRLQDALNISKGYREFITGTSTNPRHGDKSYIDGDTVHEVTARSWTIMNRYLELRIAGVAKLPLAEFPILN